MGTIEQHVAQIAREHGEKAVGFAGGLANLHKLPVEEVRAMLEAASAGKQAMDPAVLADERRREDRAAARANSAEWRRYNNYEA